jgi:hypothetical protein
MMKAPKPVSDERLREIEKLAYEPVRIDSKSAIQDAMRLAVKFANCAPEIAEICKELRCWRSTYGED